MNHFNRSIKICYQTGYQAALIDLQSNEDYKAFMNSEFFPNFVPKIKFPLSIQTVLEYKTSKTPISLIPRITIEPNNPHSLKQELSFWRNKRCLIAVKTSKKDILEIAARDGRVDILSIPTYILQKQLTKGIISLARQNDCALDISITPFLDVEHHKRTKLLRMLYRLLLSAKPGSNNYLIGSHSLILSNPWLIRGPKETIAFLHTIYNIPENQAKNMVQKNPEQLILRFIKRDQKLFIEPGVEIVDIKKGSSE